MEIESGFSVPASPDAAYRFLLDLERVAPCIPGGTLGQPAGDGVYPASVTVKLGPMRLTYDGSIEVASSDAKTRTATLSARARETRGNGAVQSTMTMRVTPEGEGSAVAVTTDLELTGRAAQMGRGIVEDVAEKLVGEMAACLAARISVESTGSTADAPAVDASSSPAPAAKPIPLLALLRAYVRDKLGAHFPRGGHT
jgi:uncharacterized protein